MTTQTEAERLADVLEWRAGTVEDSRNAAAELRRLVSFNQQLMDEVARLNKAVADEREACADAVRFADNGTEAAEIIRARGNT